MNTPMILATVESPPASQKQGGHFQNAGHENTGPTFSKVLTDQQAAGKSETTRAAHASTPSYAATADATNADATPPGASHHDTEPPEADDYDTALLVAQNGASLPQIALGIASQAALVTKAASTSTDELMRGRSAKSGPGIVGEGTHRIIEPAMTEAGRPGGISVDPAAAQYVATGRITSGELQQQPARTIHQTQVDRLKASSQPGPGKGHADRTPARSLATAPHETVQNQDTAAASLNIAQSGYDDTDRPLLADAASLSGTLLSAGAGNPGAVVTSHHQTLNAGASAISAAVTTPLQFAQWGSDFARQFMTLVPTGDKMSHTAELRLDPPELGPIRISITIQDNVAQASFISPHAAVRQAVENALPQLQDSLAQAGISLGQTNVSDQQQSRQAYSEPTGRRRTGPDGPVNGIEGSGIEVVAHAATRARVPNALVDTFA